MNAIQQRSADFDFDQWAALAECDGDAFEGRRQERINEAIEKAVSWGGDERRLRGLQCRIDLERQRAKTPLKACLRLSSLMWDSVFELSEQVALHPLGAHPPADAGEDHPSASIIPFPSP